MLSEKPSRPPDFERWIPLAKQVVNKSLALGWNDVLEIYSYIPTIPLAEALALEARRKGSDTHITLMTDDLWFTSMQELPVLWLRAPSQVEIAINKAITAYVYLGGPRDARRMRNIPPEKFTANSTGNFRQDEPQRKRRVRMIDLPIGRVCPERAEAYGLNFELWEKSYNSALSVDLSVIRKVGVEWANKLRRRREVKITSSSGTDLAFETKPIEPMVEDGIVSASDVRRGFVFTSLPPGKIVAVVSPNSVRGSICFSDPVFMMGRSVKGLRLAFEKGKLVHWVAEENGELLSELLKSTGASRNQLRWFSIGLNPAPEPCMLDNSIVENDVGIGLGPHPVLERSKIGSAPYFEGTMGPSKVELSA